MKWKAVFFLPTALSFVFLIRRVSFATLTRQVVNFFFHKFSIKQSYTFIGQLLSMLNCKFSLLHHLFCMTIWQILQFSQGLNALLSPSIYDFFRRHSPTSDLISALHDLAIKPSKVDTLLSSKFMVVSREPQSPLIHCVAGFVM